MASRRSTCDGDERVQVGAHVELHAFIHSRLHSLRDSILHRAVHTLQPHLNALVMKGIIMCALTLFHEDALHAP
jgi:hypothetical protein